MNISNLKGLTQPHFIRLGISKGYFMWPVIFWNEIRTYQRFHMLFQNISYKSRKRLQILANTEERQCWREASCHWHESRSSLISEALEHYWMLKY